MLMDGLSSPLELDAWACSPVTAPSNMTLLAELASLIDTVRLPSNPLPVELASLIVWR